MWYYKSLCAAVTICSTLVNIQTHRKHFESLTSLYEKKLIRRWDIRTWHRSILLLLLRLTPPTEGFSWDDLRKILHEGQRMAEVQNREEILPKVSTPWVWLTNASDDYVTLRAMILLRLWRYISHLLTYLLTSSWQWQFIGVWTAAHHRTCRTTASRSPELTLGGICVPPTVNYLQCIVTGSTLTAVSCRPHSLERSPGFYPGPDHPTMSGDCFRRLLKTYLFARY